MTPTDPRARQALLYQSLDEPMIASPARSGEVWV